MASQYYNTDLNSSRVNVRMPEYDTSGLLKAGQAIGNSLDYWKNKDIAEQERLLQAKKEQHALDREKLMDSRYEADKQEKLDDKNRLLQKDYNTANAMSAIENKDAYIAGRMSSEQKAIQDTLTNATPEDRLQMQQELKGYDPKASGQQWAGTALSQSNVDSKDITNLKRDITKEAEQTRQFNENKRIAQENFNKTYSLQKLQYDQTAQEKKDAKAGKLAGISAFMNNNVENSTMVPRDSKTGEMIIKDENLNAHKEAFNEFGKTKDIQELTSKLNTAQQNGSKLYTDEQLADPVFVKKLYDESQAGQKSQASGLIKQGIEYVVPLLDYAKEDRKKAEEIIIKIDDLKKQNLPLDKFFTKGYENENKQQEINSLNDQLNLLKDKNKNQNPEVTYKSLEDFSTNLKATNKTKKNELVTLQGQLDSAYKTKDIELKNKFGAVKKENVYVPKEEKQYAQDIVTSEFEKAKKENRTLSVDEQAAIVVAAKDIAKNHQVKVDKALDDELKVRIKKMEKATEAQKLEYNTYDDQIKVIDTQINKIAHGNAGEKDLYSINNPKAGDITPENAIIELKANREQLIALQKDLANKISR